ncbi:MAG: hypothetical protein ABFD91_15005 [Anaerohalosphaeraceae bacterium]
MSVNVQGIEPKTIAAVVLVGLMLVLWGRALLRKGPAGAQAAAPASSQTQKVSGKAQVQIQPLVLTMIPGRHDTIASDCFKTDRWTVFQWAAPQSQTEKAVDSGSNQTQSKPSLSMDAVAKAFALEAIIKNNQAQPEKACINGAVVSVGSELRAKIQSEIILVTVEVIESNRVVLKWQDNAVELKMPEVESGQ